MESELCNVDLTKIDEYEGYVIPDKDLEITLKVLRTLRNACLYLPPTPFKNDEESYDANGAVLLSHAHAKIVDMVKGVQEIEKREREEDGKV